MVCPLAKMYTLGSNFIPSANHAGGLRYHGMSPVLSQLYADGLMEAVAVEQTAVFEAAEQFASLTGTGYFDMYAYEKFHDGKMTDYIPTEAELEESFTKLPPQP